MKGQGVRHKRLRAFLLLAVGIVLGACREFLFINLNYQIDHVARHTRFSYAHTLFQGWTQGLGLSGLMVLKWSLAAAFTAAMAALSVLMARVLQGSWAMARPILAGFILFVALALLLHALSGWRPQFEAVSIQVSHMLQYPVMLLFILLAAGLARPGPPTA